MRFTLLLFSPLLPLFTAFLYFFIKRAAATLGHPVQSKKGKWLLLCGAIFTVAVIALFSDLGLLLLLHLTALGFLTQLINFILKKALKTPYSKGFHPWKKIYGSGILALILTAAVITGGYINLHTVVRTDYTVTTEKPIREQGYRIALIADVHFGVSLDEEEVLGKCEEINAADPDLVILCGDMVDNDTSKEGMEALFRAFGTLQSEFGTFYVHGNHDRSMSIVSNHFTEEELLTNLKENNITLLQDSTLQLTEDLVLIGREDKSRRSRASLESLTKALSSEDFWLVLDHQPNEYTINGNLGTDLLLSGHTHGGQLFPLNLLMQVVPFNDGTYGMYEIGATGKAIVTSGFAGWNFPIKTAAPSEYVIIDILPE